MMDILNLAPGERTIELHHPASEAHLIGIRLTIRSIDDPALARLKREFSDEYLRKSQRNKVQKTEEIEENTTKLLTKAITDWEWYNPTGVEGDKGFDPDKQPHLDGDTNPEFNEKNVKRLLSNPMLRRQITEETEDTKAFFDD